MALSANGHVAVVGAFRDGQGVAYVFQQRDGTWTEQQELRASDGAPDDEFGISIALSADGNVALVGAKRYFDERTGRRLYLRGAGQHFNQQQELQPSDGYPDDLFGFSVALSAGGDVAIVCAGGFYGNPGPGAAYVFQKRGGGWTQQQKLQAGDGTVDDEFGFRVALNTGGNVALVGADAKDGGQGAAYVFQERGGSWTQQQKLQASDGGDFGSSVALSASGKVALVGARVADGKGAAYVFEERGRSWTQQQKLQASDGAAQDFFGFSVALSAGGHVALVGTLHFNVSPGAAYIFEEQGGASTQQQELHASDGAPFDWFGFCVKLSADGHVALVGAPSFFGNALGAAYVFNER